MNRKTFNNLGERWWRLHQCNTVDRFERKSLQHSSTFNQPQLPLIPLSVLISHHFNCTLWPVHLFPAVLSSHMPDKAPVLDQSNCPFSPCLHLGIWMLVNYKTLICATIISWSLVSTVASRLSDYFHVPSLFSLILLHKYFMFLLSLNPPALLHFSHSEEMTLLSLLWEQKPVKGVWVQPLVREVDPTCCNLGSCHN